jgi:hypothetical protein
MADLQDDRPAPTLTIHRIYAKGERPRKEEIPKEYSLADLATDQVMVRRRLYGKQRFVKKDGLVPPSASYPKLWHNDIEAHDEDDSDDEEDEDDPFDYPLERTDRIYEERRYVETSSHLHGCCCSFSSLTNTIIVYSVFSCNLLKITNNSLITRHFPSFSPPLPCKQPMKQGLVRIW